MSLRDIARVLFRRKRLIGLTLALAGAGGWAGAVHMPQTYRAQAALLPPPGAEEALAALLAGRAQIRRDGGLVRVALDGAEPSVSQVLAGLVTEARARLPAARDPKLESEARAAEADAAVQAERLAVLKSRLAATPATIQLSSEAERPQVLEAARAKLFELDAKEQELLGKYQEASPFVQAVRAERARLAEQLKTLETPREARTRTGANEVHQELEKEANRAEASATAARARAKALSRQLEQLPAAAVAVVEAPGPAEPVGPTRGQVLGAALAAGLVLGLAWAALAERFSRTLSTPAEVERRLGLAVLSDIPARPSKMT